MTFSDEELERYSRQMILPQVGGPGQRRLKAAKLAIIGAGAIGTSALAALSGAGVGRITIIDDDEVQLSNLHRQFIYRSDQIGSRKAGLSASFASALNPAVEIMPLERRIDRENAAKILAGHELVIDGSDNFATRLAVSDACVNEHIALVSAAAAQLQAQIALFRGWETNQPCYRCFVGDAFDSDDCDTCAEMGILGPVAAFAAQFASILALRVILGLNPDVAGQLFSMDANSLKWRSLRLPKDSRCKGCGGYAATS